MNRFMQTRRAGFTLIELLVVISIITLLISLLLPTIGEVRRQARIINCTQNQKQLGLAAQTYASSNDDELPNAPELPRGAQNVQQFGEPGRTAYRFAADQENLSTNGFGFGQNGIYTLTSVQGSELFNAGITGMAAESTMSMHNMFWVVLSQYIEGGSSGIAGMNDVFLSPSDANGQNDWDVFKERVRANNGVFPSPAEADTFAADNEMSAGSYLYVPCAMYSPDASQYTESGPTDLTDRFDFTTAVQSMDNFYDFIKRNRMSDMRYGSSKVLFYMGQPYHNPELQAWFQEGAQITVGLGDGSARVTDPQNDLVPLNYSEDAGCPLILEFTAQAEDEGAPVTSTYFGSYFATDGGIRGRDLR